MSAQSEVDLYNLALDELGQSPIQSFSAEAPGAENAERRYRQVIGEITEARPWSFLMQRVALSRLGEASPTHYSFQFDVPGNEQVHAVYDRAESNRPFLDYRFMDGRVHANCEALHAEVRLVRSPELWPHKFRQLAIKALAAAGCMQHTGSRTLRNDLMQEAYGLPSEAGRGGLMGQAIALDGQNEPSAQLVLEDGPLIDVRH
jgi:hypothetical protein